MHRVSILTRVDHRLRPNVLSALLFLALLAAMSMPTCRAEEPTTAPNQVQANKNVSLVGNWVGPLKVGPIELRLALKISTSDEGDLSAKLDSIDQGAKDLVVDEITWADGTVTAKLKAIGGTFSGKLDAAQNALVGTWTQGPNSFPLTLKKIEGEVELKRPQEPKPPYPYDVEEVTFPNKVDQITLAGTLTLPRGKGPFIGVILISGSGPQDRDEAIMGHKPFHVLADHLTRQGIAVLRFDDRGVGKSQGDFAKATAQEFKRDTIAAIEFVQTRSEIRKTSIGLCGHSEGGIIAPMAAVETPGVAFVILMAGTGVTGEEILYRQGELIARSMGANELAISQNQKLQKQLFEQMRRDPKGEHLDEKLKELVAEIPGEEERKVAEQSLKAQANVINSPWFRSFLTYDPRPVLQKLTCPVLAIVGEHDLQVDPKQNLPQIEQALAAGRNKQATVKEIPGLNHLFQSSETGAITEYGQIEETMDPEVLTLIADWILAHGDSRRK